MIPGPPLETLVAAVLLGTAGLLFALLFVLDVREDGLAQRRRQRLAQLKDACPDVGRAATPDGEGRGAAAALLALRSRGLARFRLPSGGVLTLPPVLAGIAAAAGGAMLAGQVLALGPLQVAAVSVASGLAAMTLVFHHAAARRRVAFLETLPDAIDLMIRAVRAGIPVSAAITLVGEEVAEPVGGEFKRISDAVAIGVELKEALRRTAKRVRIPDFDFFTICLLVQQETGGQLTETLQNLSDILRRRKEVRRKVRALTSEGRTSAKVVGAIPFLSGGGFYMISPGYVGRLVAEPMGVTMLLIAGACLILGTVVIAFMTRSDT
ncbi:MAG TPA: type II secretion system F family protein [Azospirillum sp.]|nr:type II secretion system F family protein [Azospirillum sp.]